MKLHKSLIVATICLLTTACEQHEEVIDYSLKVGNICCSNGNIVPIEGYDPENMQGVGVIVHVGEENTYKAIAVALEDIGYYSYSDTLIAFSGVSADVKGMDGKENTAALLAISADEPTVSVPAADAATGYKAGNMTGWYLPACAELEMLATNKNAIKPAMEKAGGRWLDSNEWYLSSTQDGTSENTGMFYAYCVSMTGKRKDGIKTDRYPVRAFIMIE
uniref:hypothetical protein n=1 Tax=Bacteroides fragilis TaxID=817 RepID=UPI00356273DE